MHYQKFLKRVMVLATLALVVFSHSERYFCSTISDSSVSKESKELDKSYAVAVKNASVYEDASTSSVVLDSVSVFSVVEVVSKKGHFYKINYCGEDAFVLCDNFLVGSEYEEFIENNYFVYDTKAVLKQKSLLVNEDTCTALLVSEGESFCVLGDKDDDYYEVLYDDCNYLLKKSDVKKEIFVSVQDFVKVDPTVSLAAQVVSYGSRFIGNPYVWGGTSLTNGADCSGFVQSVYGKFGIELPRTSKEQACFGESVKINSMRKGDLVFFEKSGEINHVAIYVGNGKILHAKGVEYGIVETDLDFTSIACVRRVLGE